MAEDKKPTYIDGVGWRYETEHSMLRRMAEHDYRSRCIYMLTMTTEGRLPVLGNLRWPAGKPENARVERTHLGEEVAKCWANIPRYHEGVTTFPLMVMPDHVHGIIFVKKEQECHLGQMVNGFKVGCNKALRAMRGVDYSETMPPNTGTGTGGADYSETAPPNTGTGTRGVDYSETMPPNTGTGTGGADYSETMPPNTGAGSGAAGKKDKHPEHGMLFTPGYQDSVLMGKGQLENMIRYIAMNPYRLAMKRENREFFRQVSELTIHTDDGQKAMTFAAIGNRWLLDNPIRMQVRCHNNTTEENLRLIARQTEYFLDRGKKGGVIVSPCISDGEKAVARAALDAGVPLVVILENGFPPMYKPPGKYFEACARGLLLMLAPWPYHMERRKITRVQCLELNDMARRLSTEPWSQELEERLKQSMG